MMSKWLVAGAIVASVSVTVAVTAAERSATQPGLGTRAVPILRIGGLRFRDLDRDGRLSPFEDWRLSPERRAADLVHRMTLEEKAGAMMHPVLSNSNPSPQIDKEHVTSFLLRNSGPADKLAEQLNRTQEIAERGRLAIPLTISTDPRNGVGDGSYGTSVSAGQFSRWPDALGFGAIGDPALVRQFAAMAAQEYRAVGITMALSPQADLGTEPRWPRIGGTFGEEPGPVGRLAAAYVEGFQGGPRGVTTRGVATVIKHFAGYGAQADQGFDSHNYYGRFARLTKTEFERHVASFRSSIRANVAGAMPTYSILEVPGFPRVGGAFNKVLLQDVLRRKEGFRGLIVSDWGVTQDCDEACIHGRAPGEFPTKITRGKPWGMETASRAERFVAAVNAGVDQIGDEEDSAPLVDAVRKGIVPEARLDRSVRAIMALKFRLGLFENPYVDPQAAARTVGQPAFQQAGLRAQERALVLLGNGGDLLPYAAPGKRVYLKGVSPAVAAAAGFTVVKSPEQADVAIIRTATPSQRLHPLYIMGAIQHEGDLDFKSDNPDLIAIREAARHVPTIVSVYLDRPAVLTEIRKSASALIVNFGVSDEALLNVITGKARPEGHLPFELPSSMDAVRRQRPDLPHDSIQPLYRYGYGLTYR